MTTPTHEALRALEQEIKNEVDPRPGKEPCADFTEFTGFDSGRCRTCGWSESAHQLWNWANRIAALLREAEGTPQSTDESMKNACRHCGDYHDGACDPAAVERQTARRRRAEGTPQFIGPCETCNKTDALARDRENHVFCRRCQPWAEGTPPPQAEGDLPTDHPNRCKLRDRLFLMDGNECRPAWRCHKRAGHDGPCSSHNDCGVIAFDGVTVCGLRPGHIGPHAYETRIMLSSPAPTPDAQSEGEK